MERKYYNIEILQINKRKLCITIIKLQMIIGTSFISILDLHSSEKVIFKK